MRRFQPGQRVVCTHPTEKWSTTELPGLIAPGPKYGDIVTVREYSWIHEGFIVLEEYPLSCSGNELPDCYHQKWFEPLMDINELTESIKEPAHENF
jgi:hypothetical protein